MAHVDKPAISVVLSVYNGSEYLAEAIDSILNQTFTDFELIMMDDGSTDASLEVMNRYATLDSRCRVYSRENKGLIASRNELIALSRADIIANMDADDICLPERLEKQYKFLSAHPECVVVSSTVLLIDSDGAPICNFWTECSHDEIDKGNLSGGGSFLCNPAATMRKSAVLSVGGLRHGYEHAEDIDLYLRLAEVGKVVNLPEVLFKYRQHFSSIGYAKRQKQNESMLLAVNAARTRRNLPKLNKSTFVNEEERVFDTYMKWGWWAFSAENYKTSIKYAFKGLLISPNNSNLLKLLILSIKSFLAKNIKLNSKRTQKCV